MLSVTDADGNQIKVTEYDPLGNPLTVTQGSDLFTYQYTEGGAAEQLDYVTLTRGSTVIAKAQYTYSGTGDLKQVRVSTYNDASSQLAETGGSYYRYSTQTIGCCCSNQHTVDDLADAVTGLAYARLVDAVFGADATAAAPLPGSTASLDSANLTSYADQFSYDSQNRVQWQFLVGAGSSSLDGSPANSTTASLVSAVGGFKYTYQITGQTQGVGIGDWSQDTTITLANGTTQQVYTNFAGEPLLSALTDTTDAVNPKLNGVIWNTFFAYDLQGRLLFTAEPSTKVQPNPSNPSLLSLAGSNQGLIDGTDYHTTTGTNGTVAGYVEDTYVEHGQQASTKAIQDYYRYLNQTGVSIHPVSDDTVYSAATSNVNDPSGRNTHFAYNITGTHITQITETLPAVGAGQDGIGGTGTIVTDYNSYGQVADVTDADGYKTTYSYDDINTGGSGSGVLVKTVQNLDTAGTKTITTSSAPICWGGRCKRPTATETSRTSRTPTAFCSRL